MVCTSEYMAHHMQMFRDVGGIKRNRKRDFPIKFFCHILDVLLLPHAVDEVDMAEMPTDSFWVL